MDITRVDAKNIAALAKLSLRPEDIDDLIDQLVKFRGYVQTLAINAKEQVAPHDGTEFGGTFLGKGSALSQEQVLALAPDSWQGFIRVPRVVDYD